MPEYVDTIDAAYEAAAAYDAEHAGVPGCMTEGAECDNCMTCVGVSDHIADGWVDQFGMP